MLGRLCSTQADVISALRASQSDERHRREKRRKGEGESGRERGGRRSRERKGRRSAKEHWDSSRKHEHNFSVDCEDGTHRPVRAIQLGTGLFGWIRKGRPEDSMAE